MKTRRIWSSSATTRPASAPDSRLCMKPMAEVTSNASALAASSTPTPTYTTSSARVKARATHSRASSDRPALGTSGDAVLRRTGESLIDRVGDGLQRVGRALQVPGGPAPHISRCVVEGIPQLVTPQPHHRHARHRAHKKALHLADLHGDVLPAREQMKCRAAG